MNFGQDVTLLTIAHDNHGMLEHSLQAYVDHGTPAAHVIWVNDFNYPVWDVVQRYKEALHAKVIHTTNLGYHAPADIVAELIGTEYLFLMPSDFRVTRPTWMQEYAALCPASAIGVPGSCSRSKNGILEGPPAGTPWAWPPHLRSGGILLHAESFKEMGKFGADGSLSAQEVRMSRMMLALGMKVRVIEDAPFYDYGDWGNRHWPGIAQGSLEDLKAFDAKFGVKAQDTTY